MEAANRFLRETYIAECNRRFAVEAEQKGTALTKLGRKDLKRVFSIQEERTVNRDHTVEWAGRVFQMEAMRFRNTLAGPIVTVHEHWDGQVSVEWGPHRRAIQEWRAEPKRAKRAAARLPGTVRRKAG
jgi:hypothetical protein